jgi:hypothetical protein
MQAGMAQAGSIASSAAKKITEVLRCSDVMLRHG